VDWTYLVQGRIDLRALENMVINLRFLQRVGDFMTVFISHEDKKL
jgi:hypothetical protein